MSSFLFFKFRERAQNHWIFSGFGRFWKKSSLIFHREHHTLATAFKTSITIGLVWFVKLIWHSDRLHLLQENHWIFSGFDIFNGQIHTKGTPWHFHKENYFHILLAEWQWCWCISLLDKTLRKLPFKFCEDWSNTFRVTTNFVPILTKNGCPFEKT